MVIFSKSSCCICHSIKKLIHGFGASPTIYELDELSNEQQLERELLSLGREPSVPAVFMGGELVGSSNEVMSLHLQGRLVQLLIQAGAIFVQVLDAKTASLYNFHQSSSSSQPTLNSLSLHHKHSSTIFPTMATVTALVAEKPMVIFSKSSCCICHSVKKLIHGFGASPTIYELDELSNGQQLERELLSLGREPSVPAVFIGGELVGGSKEVMSLHLQGKLVQLLIQAGAIFVQV
ncbi:Monothiol glutaredoxin-S2 [Camellia lanceoleosa]|uniref:Monothiol glutaredoxin-S2 n=1 Tax=Camellia lanceoleosa TaxID=1840588 RepID=A0ACC0FQM4_9ERIC|nr:Monothiol glutaredoxin-S2 [Camellia lanceoleosa]